jgi:hypothetical protein
VTIPSNDGGNIQGNGVLLGILKQENGSWKFQAVSFSRVNAPKKE